MTHLLRPGERIHVIHRRLFDKDIRRHFIGEVDFYDSGLIRATGYVFAIDENQGHNFTRRPDKRSRILSLNDGSLIVNVIPLLVNIESVVYEEDMSKQTRRLWLSWEDYMREWCLRPDFRAALPSLLEGEDEDFQKLIAGIAAKEAAKRA